MSEQPASARVYSTAVLYGYDFWVHFVSAKLAWKVNTNNMHKLYTDHLNKDNHLEIGVGTGLFIVPQAATGMNIDIADINTNALKLVETKIIAKRATVNIHEVDLYKPMKLPKQYGSIGLNYVLHCLEGDKKAILQRVSDQLEDGGTLFGTTLLNEDLNAFASYLTDLYNRKKYFSNTDDTEENMVAIIKSVLPNAQFKREGNVLFFTAIK